jgi:hypothetical protein
MLDKFDRNAISNENLYYANLKKEKRIKDQTDEIEREKIAMENLKNQMEKEKQYLKDKREKIKQAQYEDYNNYLMQKYSTPPQYREKLNIKLGGEQRNIRKTNYNEEMDNLCINPTNQKYEEYPNVINYSEMGRRYQKGYSHGYNIITGEVYSNKEYNNNNNNEEYNNNINNNHKEIKDERKGINISPEEYQEFLRYKEMKKQKEMEMENRQQIKKEQYNNNINNEIRGNRNDYYEYEKQPKEYLNQYQNYQNNNQNINDNRKNMNNNFHYDEQSETPKRFNEIKEKENFIKQQNKYYEDYQNRLLSQNQRQEQIPQYYNEQQNIRKEPQINQENNNEQINEYVYENIHRKFTQSDIDFIYDVCNGLAEIIINELNDNVTNFFLKKDKNGKGYFTLNDFKDILYHDLKIDYKNDMNNFQVFLDFILSDKMIQNEYIVEINKLIFIIKTYSEKYNNQNNIDNRQYEQKQMVENKQYNNNYDNRENEEQIQFSDNISFPSNQQINLNEQNNNNIRNNEQLPNQYKNNENMNNNIKDIEREKYLQFLKEQSGQNNQIRNYPPEENYNNNQYQGKNPNEFDQQNNNYSNAPDYYKQRELTPQPQPQNEYLSYQEQIKRIKEQNKYQQDNKQISEYNKNKMRNINTEDNIFKIEKPEKIEPKYNDQPLTEKEKKEIIQKDYAKYLDWQIQEKNRNVKTPFYQRNYNPILDDNNNNQQMNQKEYYMKNNPIVPNRNNNNYDMNSRKFYNNNYMK